MPAPARPSGDVVSGSSMTSTASRRTVRSRSSPWAYSSLTGGMRSTPAPSTLCSSGSRRQLQIMLDRWVLRRRRRGTRASLPESILGNGTCSGRRPRSKVAACANRLAAGRSLVAPNRIAIRQTDVERAGVGPRSVERVGVGTGQGWEDTGGAGPSRRSSRDDQGRRLQLPASLSARTTTRSQ